MVYGLPTAVSVEIVKLACPLPFSASGPARVAPGLAQVPPLKNVTLPAVAGLPAPVTVAVKVTDWAKVEGFGADVTVVALLALLTTWLTLPLPEFRFPLPP